ncbi:hypothetical protein Srot_0052 [Segniliparus rotundus DSM 44985]|uniref:Helix-turn-helix domain-containing protein n=1 Tax=Segniliparus rotundus (strain ATCC BAA-972 / CDC 1076 / CIP 108378 / DSM 44985 / JCM 13578) TaxID=640132 RepID=D6Z9L8_SEGRD|nr:hypothetical protein [Segniliparus rotundus]ADG96545.1 hypothetical protein Srot_0052 [Segniliparus rotundus DSM 44985]
MNALLDVDVPEFVTVERAVRATGRSRRTIYRWKESGAVRWRMFEGKLMVEVNDADEAKLRCSDARRANLRRKR